MSTTSRADTQVSTGAASFEIAASNQCLLVLVEAFIFSAPKY
jgi:hypothetical protein